MKSALALPVKPWIHKLEIVSEMQLCQNKIHFDESKATNMRKPGAVDEELEMKDFHCKGRNYDLTFYPGNLVGLVRKAGWPLFYLHS